MLAQVVLSLLLIAAKAEPPDACETMEPSHGGTPQPGSPPFVFYLDKELVLSRLSAHFAIKSVSRRNTFSGFMVQVRDQAGVPVGQFDPGCADIKVMSCFGVFANTAVHLDSSPKTEAHMRWMPDLDFVGNVSVFVTVAQSRQVYWSRHRARQLQVVKDVA